MVVVPPVLTVVTMSEIRLSPEVRKSATVSTTVLKMLPTPSVIRSTIDPLTLMAPAATPDAGGAVVTIFAAGIFWIVDVTDGGIITVVAPPPAGIVTVGGTKTEPGAAIVAPPGITIAEGVGGGVVVTILAAGISRMVMPVAGVDEVTVLILISPCELWTLSVLVLLVLPKSFKVVAPLAVVAPLTVTDGRELDVATGGAA